MTAGPPVTAPDSGGPWRSGRGPEAVLLALLALVSLLPDPWAISPRSAYYFRDLSVTFLPVRTFAADELRHGRWPVWNPFLFEGTFALPYFHLFDLVQALAPGPVAFSFLLTLQFPLAALAAYFLLRDLGAGRLGGFAGGALFALGGLTRSSANMYVFLQALAAAPLVLLTLRRAAQSGGRWIPLGAAAVALGLTTLALEFVAQAVALGGVWAFVERPSRAAARRVALVVALAFGLASVAILPTLGLLPETTRGAGFESEVLLGHSTPAPALLQLLIPNLFGSLADPVREWWGQRFFDRLPYFLSLYVGPIALALAWAGWPRLGPRLKALTAVAGLGAVWFALGEAGRLAPALLPLLPVFRYPSKAWLIPYLLLAVAAGLGASELAEGRGWRRFLALSLGMATLSAALILVLLHGGGAVAAYAGHTGATARTVIGALTDGAAIALALCLTGAGLALAVAKGWLEARLGAALATALLASDLVRAHYGLNPQVDPSFYDLQPEIASALDPDGRVLSYPLAHSPAFLRFLQTGPPEARLASFYVNRQLMSPYLNVLDRVGAPDDRDLTSFTQRPGRLRPEDYRPEAVGRLLPWMRQAGVTRVLSLDPLEHPDLVPRARVELGPPGLAAHVYALARPAPRVYVACRVVRASSSAEADDLPLRPGFDLSSDAAVEESLSARCAAGDARTHGWWPSERHYHVRADAEGLLVERENYARGWRAEVDGRTTRVLRVNGKHRGVPFPAGEHRIVLRYEAPLLGFGVATSLGSVLLCLLLLRVRPSIAERPRPTVLAPAPEVPFACPKGHTGPLLATSEGPPALACSTCQARYPIDEGILNLTRGRAGAAGYDPHYFATLPNVEDGHFWYVARRERILGALHRHVPDLGRRALLDVGCGSGGLLSWLEASGVRLAGGCDAYPEGLRVARRRLGAPLALVDLGHPPPLAPEQSLLAFFDVLEHIDDDRATLTWAWSILAPGGVLVLTVPAHPALFDEMDRLAHHRRRYRRAELHEKLEEAGFEVRHLGHFMALLVPGLLLARSVGRLLPGALRDPARRRDAELRVVPGLNAVLLGLLRLEALVGRIVSWPFGTSLLAVAVRPASAYPAVVRAPATDREAESGGSPLAPGGRQD